MNIKNSKFYFQLQFSPTKTTLPCPCWNRGRRLATGMPTTIWKTVSSLSNRRQILRAVGPPNCRDGNIEWKAAVTH